METTQAEDAPQLMPLEKELKKSSSKEDKEKVEKDDLTHEEYS